MAPSQTLAEFLREHGFPADFPLDGEYHRFSLKGGGDANAFFCGRSFVFGDKTVTRVLIGDWSRGFQALWESPNAGLTDAEREELEKATEAKLAELRAERQAKWEKEAENAEWVWAACIDRGPPTPYLQRKGIDQLYGCKLDCDSPDVLILPLRDIEGKLWSFQRIEPDGTKRLAKGGKKKGCFHLIGEVSPKGKLLVCEGLATAASVHQATGYTTAVAIDSGNLPAVCFALTEKYPEVEVLVCADDDQWTTRKVDGKDVPWNPGREAAQAAVETCRPGVQWIVPQFENLEGRPTDWNDLHTREGIAKVKEQILNPRPPVSPLTPFGQVRSLPPRKNKKTGTVQAPSEEDVATYLVEHFGGTLVKQDRDLFRYVGTHWKLLTLGEQDQLKCFIQEVCSGMANVKHLDACYRMLVYKLPHVPEGVDLFVPNPFCANFLNGTLHLDRGQGNKYTLRFTSHEASDWLVNVLPFDYREEGYPENVEFTAMLDRVFQGNEDKASKIRAVSQMYGACLVPLFPRLFMLHGQPGTGKSTVLKIAARLVHKDNLSKVAPSDFGGFNLESMAGKLVNLDTDIPFDAPMRDEIVKKIIDRQSFRIRRKGIKDLYAPIPSVHMFGANELPRFLDGASGAHTRRWTFIEFDAFVPVGNYDQEYDEWCFGQGAEGVLGFALQGLKDLCASGGHFVNPPSGVENLLGQQLHSDPVGLFLKDVERGEIFDGNSQLTKHFEAKIERKLAWENFRSWHVDSFNRPPWLGKHAFFKALRRKKMLECCIDGVNYWQGFGVRVSPEGKF
jgi:phage/plasmid primase-like uncharacterized protein